MWKSTGTRTEVIAAEGVDVVPTNLVHLAQQKPTTVEVSLVASVVQAVAPEVVSPVVVVWRNLSSRNWAEAAARPRTAKVASLYIGCWVVLN